VLTFNDYLASRDAEWMAPFIACSTFRRQRCFEHDTDGTKSAYAFDSLFHRERSGFDFLRDQQCVHSSQIVQRNSHSRSFDEADSILIDQGRIPLVIAKQSVDDPTDVSRFACIARKMRRHTDYSIDSGRRNVSYNSRSRPTANTSCNAASYTLLITRTCWRG